MNSPGRVVCFGEILIRLSAPDSQVLLQHPRLDVFIGGAEANVAVSLSRLGTPAHVVSVIPDNALGRAALDELRRHGVGVSGVRFAPGRMGLYFLTPGAVVRPSEVLYDRANSAFALSEPNAVDWSRELDGAAWLHVSGVTPALGAKPAAAALRAMQDARRKGVAVSFDGNYRAKLWAAWDGDGPSILKSLMENADIAFVDDRDIALVLGKTFTDSDAVKRRRQAAEAAFKVFPNLKRIASTFRKQDGVEYHQLSGMMFTRANELRTRDFNLMGVVDRIGAGDAFAAGVLHGLLKPMDDAAALEFGVAAACLKHAIPGDFNLASEKDVRDLLASDSVDVRR